MSIKDRPDGDAASEGEEDINAEDPSNAGFTVLCQLVGGYICLVDTDGVHVAERGEHAAEGAQRDEPCLQAAFRIDDVFLFGSVQDR